MKCPGQWEREGVSRQKPYIHTNDWKITLIREKKGEWFLIDVFTPQETRMRVGNHIWVVNQQMGGTGQREGH